MGKDKIILTILRVSFMGSPKRIQLSGDNWRTTRDLLSVGLLSVCVYSVH